MKNLYRTRTNGALGGADLSPKDPVLFGEARTESAMKDTKSRRHFLVVATTSLCAVAVAGCGGGGVGSLPPTINAGNVKDVPIGTLEPVGGQAVAVGRDAAGLYAMSLFCTHAECDMSQQGSVSPAGIACNCHGSRFDANGGVIHGPARTPLEHFLVTVDGAGNITINTQQAVSADTRVPVTMA